MAAVMSRTAEARTPVYMKSPNSIEHKRLAVFHKAADGKEARFDFYQSAMERRPSETFELGTDYELKVDHKTNTLAAGPKEAGSVGACMLTMCKATGAAPDPATALKKFMEGFDVDGTETSLEPVILGASRGILPKKSSSNDIQRRASGSDLQKKASGADIHKKAGSSDIQKKASGTDIHKKTGAPEVQKKTAAAEAAKKPGTPDIQKKASGTDIRKKTGAPETQKKPATEAAKKPGTPEIQKKPAAAEAAKKPGTPDIQKKASGTDIRKKAGTAEAQKKPAAAEEQQPGEAESQKKAAGEDAQEKADAPEIQKKGSGTELQKKTPGGDLPRKTSSPELPRKTSNGDLPRRGSHDVLKRKGSSNLSKKVIHPTELQTGLFESEKEVTGGKALIYSNTTEDMFFKVTVQFKMIDGTLKLGKTATRPADDKWTVEVPPQSKHVELVRGKWRAIQHRTVIHSES